jgi:hypothetical protein
MNDHNEQMIEMLKELKKSIDDLRAATTTLASNVFAQGNAISALTNSIGKKP